MFNCQGTVDKYVLDPDRGLSWLEKGCLVDYTVRVERHNVRGLAHPDRPSPPEPKAPRRRLGHLMDGVDQ